MSNVFRLNDYYEVLWFQVIARQVLDDIIQGAQGPGGSSVNQQYAHYLWRWLHNEPLDQIYCACFSTCSDDLNQFRAYAGDGRGGAIHCDLTTLLGANERLFGLRIVNVEYNNDQQRAKAREVIEQFAVKVASGSDAHGQAALAAQKIRTLAPQFKNAAFSAERELRVIVADSNFSNSASSAWMPSARQTLPQIEFAERDGRIVPYIAIEVPVEAIVGITLGPRLTHRLDAEAIRLLLSVNGFDPDVSVERSRASYL